VTIKPELIRRLLRFAFVGGMVMAVFMGLNWLLGCWINPQVAFLLAYPPALALHYMLNKWWAFGCVRTDSTRQITEYLGMVAVTFVVQYGVFWLAHDRFGLVGWLSAGVANAAQMALTFVIMQRRVFTKISVPVLQ
jgi:putative flippase GtrA